MEFFTPGNILTVAICVVTVLLFRQLDKNNRSLEKVKKFGDRLKEELDAFVKDRAAALEEKSISLEVQQTKAVAAVKRLESIREDLDRREADLLDRTKAVEDFGGQLAKYDSTIAQLLEMTARAETNLSKIRAESDFADGLAKKLMASRRQLEDIEATIPTLEAHFAEMNGANLSKIHDDVIAATGKSVDQMAERVSRAEAQGEELLAKTSERLKELYQKALNEAAKKADALEDAAFAKLKEQANERLGKYKAAAEERATQMHETLKERVAAVQQEIKSFHADWRAEADEYLEATRAEMRDLDVKTSQGISAAEERLASVRSLAESRGDELESYLNTLGRSLETSFAELSETLAARAADLETGSAAELDRLSSELSRRMDDLDSRTTSRFVELENGSESRLGQVAEAFKQRVGDLEKVSSARVSELAAGVKARLAEISGSLEGEVSKLDSNTAARIGEISESLDGRVTHLDESASSRVADIEAALHSRVSELERQTGSKLAEIGEALDERVEALDIRSRNRLDDIGGRVDGALATAASAAADEAGRLEAEFAARVADLEKRGDELLAQTVGENERRIRELSDELSGKVAKTGTDTVSKVEELRDGVNRAVSELSGALNAAEKDAANRLGELEKGIAAGTSGATARVNSEIARIDGLLSAFGKETEGRLGRFDGLIGDAERLDAALRAALEETERRVTGGFDSYAQSQQARQEEFSRRLNAASDTLAGRMQELENGLNELKSRAYDNVSERLKIFEDDFFADLAKRGDEIGAALARWREDVDSRLDALASETKEERERLENAYGAELKDGLASIADQYRAQTGRLEEQIVSVEANLRSRVTASDQAILDFANQIRADFEEARKAADATAQNEFKAHRLSVQELLRRQEQEIEARTREFAESIDGSKSEAETQLAAIRAEFASWQQKNAQQLEDARTRLDERVGELRDSADASIAGIETVWQTNYREYLTRAESGAQRVAETLAALDRSIAESNEEFERRSREALAGFTRSYEAMTAETAKRIRETGAETDAQIRTITGSVQEIREQVELSRERLMQKLQAETGGLAQTLEEIDRKQKAFISQTRVFDRAEELRATLENGIESLKAELSRLDVYRETMATLEQQYQKVRKFEEESSQKLAKFLAEKKRIDILESDFTKLLGLSDSIDRKLSEFTTTDDDLQQWQVQLRRFEETVTEVNGRYERLEKKSAVLDQTVVGVNKAFEDLKGLETALMNYRKEMSVIPGELEASKKAMDTLLAHREKTESLLDKLAALDDVLADVETRTEKMQTAREWIARTETRLEEISKQSQDQLKLLGAIMKEGGAATKAKGAPALGIRENVIKLAHQGWKVDEIARVFQLSRGEVELILELPQK